MCRVFISIVEFFEKVIEDDSEDLLIRKPVGDKRVEGDVYK